MFYFLYECRPGGCDWEGDEPNFRDTVVGTLAFCPKCGCLCTKN
jgi:hypothetical protein